ncbi:MAG TPA: VWA domain-containing protein [Bacteroidia bacterium]
MIRCFLLISYLLFQVNCFAQVTVNKGTYDHGNIESFNNDTAYFEFYNSGSKPAYLLPTLPADDYSVFCSSKTIAPGESIQVGIVYYTDQKGRFDIKIPLYFSTQSSAIQLAVKGNIKSIRETALTRCPSIENSKPLEPAQVPLKITIKDAETEQNLKEVNLKVRRLSETYNCAPGIAGSIYACKCKYGPITIQADKKGYTQSELDAMYDAEHSNFVVYLKKIKINQDSISRTITQNTVKTNNDSLITTEEEPIGYIPASYSDTGFNSTAYKPNHLIFIIDVSGSMKDSTKLNFLKAAMKKLVSTVRPQDHITLITYAYKVKLIFENYSGLDRSAILTAIDTLKANGGSNGAASMVLAYELAERYFIPDGNNQIFLATDGLFNSNSISDETLYKMVRKGYAQHNIKLSSIGFGKDLNALNFLKKLASLGRGNFLTILNKDNDLGVLVDEVKMQSKIRQ